MLDGYNKNELIHIVDMYNLEIDISKLKKSKDAIKKEMLKVGKKTLKAASLPDKPTVKKMVAKDKKKKSSLLNKVQSNKITNYAKPKKEDKGKKKEKKEEAGPAY